MIIIKVVLQTVLDLSNPDKTGKLFIEHMVDS